MLTPLAHRQIRLGGAGCDAFCRGGMVWAIRFSASAYTAMSCSVAGYLLVHGRLSLIGGIAVRILHLDACVDWTTAILVIPTVPAISIHLFKACLHAQTPNLFELHMCTVSKQAATKVW